ncbi:MAG: cytochrome P450 [Candidatus Acidiferrales bacterium]|jgi:cytochrome P450
MVQKNNPLPPGPRGLPVLGVALQLRRDPLGLLTRVAREYGDISHIPLLLQSRILINHPDLIEDVIVRQPQKFDKGPGIKGAATRLLGEGLLTSEGELWRRQRRLAQPAFHRQRIAEYAQTMVEQALAHIRNWREGDVREMADEMMALTLVIAVKTLFGTEFTHEAGRVGKSVTLLMRYQIQRLRNPFKFSEKWPTPANRRADRAYEYLNSLVYGIIEDRQRRRASGVAPTDDVLSLLMDAMDEDGSQMSSKQLRDEVMTLFIAGHETTAVTLGWAWHLLAQNPGVEQRLADELRTVLSGRTPSMDDLPRMPYLDAVIREVLRLYPAAYIIQRTSTEPIELGGYHFPANTTVLMSQWVMHRDPRYFDAPEEFRPERWLTGIADRLPAHAYFPFGGGPRRCIGQIFALTEAALVMATLAQNFRFVESDGTNVATEPLITLRAHGGIPMTLERRS